MSAPHFDSVAHVYDETLPRHVVDHYREKRLAFIGRLLARGSILDVGCGTGALARSLERTGYRVVGVDASAGMLKVFRGEGGHALAEALSDALPFRSGSFDLVITVATLHHVSAPEVVRRTLAEMVRVARPRGGQILVWDHNPINPYWPLLMRRLPQDQDGYRLVPLGEIVAGLRAAGAGGVRTIRAGWIPDFAPPGLLPILQRMESRLERLPVIRALGAHNVVVATRA
jgi:SAM-dependent methyltransferase